MRQLLADTGGERQVPATSSKQAAAPAAAPIETPKSAERVWMTPFGPMVERDPASTPKTVAAPAKAADSAPPPAAETPVDPMEVLNEALRKAGIEPSSLNLVYEKYPVYYPGGYYTNELITCDLGNGSKESYGVQLMLKNPWLTAFEIGRQMGRHA